jgi:hypothetical protein
MESADIEELRSRIAVTIGRDSILITSDDTERHFDGLSFVAFYGGALFLAFITAAGKRLWQRAKDRTEKAGGDLADLAWDTAARKLGSADHEMEHASDAKQVERIKETDDALQQLASQLTGSYLKDFLEAGEEAVKARLERDHFGERKATGIAHAVTLEVRRRIGSDHP